MDFNISSCAHFTEAHRKNHYVIKWVDNPVHPGPRKTPQLIDWTPVFFVTSSVSIFSSNLCAQKAKHLFRKRFQMS